MTKEDVLRLLACASCGLTCPKHEITYRASRFCSIECASAFIDEDDEGDWLDRPLTTRERAAVSRATPRPCAVVKPGCRTLHVAFERVTGTAEYVADDESDLRRRILDAGDDTFHYNIVGPYRHATTEPDSEALHEVARLAATLVECLKDRWQEGGSMDGDYWDAPEVAVAPLRSALDAMSGMDPGMFSTVHDDEDLNVALDARVERARRETVEACAREAEEVAEGHPGDEVKECWFRDGANIAAARIRRLAAHRTGDPQGGDRG